MIVKLIHQYGLCQKPSKTLSKRRPPFSAVSRDPKLIFIWGCSLGQVLSNYENPARNGPVFWEIIDLQNPGFLETKGSLETQRLKILGQKFYHKCDLLRCISVQNFSSIGLAVLEISTHLYPQLLILGILEVFVKRS